MNTNRRIGLLTVATIICCFLASCRSPALYDVILRSGTIYDGSGEKPYVGDVAFNDDMIAAIGDIGEARASIDIDVDGLAVAPGFVNMMSWAN